MATPKSQRIGIWIITIVMAIGAVGVYFIAIIANNNNTNSQAKAQAVYAQYEAKVKELSDKYFATLSQFSSRVGTFDTTSAQQKMVTEDLKVGDGDTIGDTTAFGAYYIGWTPDGKIFDQSISSGALNAPFMISGLKSTSVIEGWKSGLIGMKIGGARELTIPSDKAYGSTGSTDSSGNQTIAPNMPLKFIVLAVPYPSDLATLAAEYQSQSSSQ